MHPYFDLNGLGGRKQGSALTYDMVAPLCSRYLVLDDMNLPTGEIAPVAGTVFDFTKPRKIGKMVPTSGGFDQYLVCDSDATGDDGMRALVTVSSPKMQLDVLSDQPGFQCYTANGMNGSGPGRFAQHGSIAIEPSEYIDAGNHRNFPSIVLHPGQTRLQRTVYKFTSATATETRSGDAFV